MYITETTINVKNVFEKVEELNDIGKVKFILYTFGLLNNNQINNKNEINPTLNKDEEEMTIFKMDLLGLSESACNVFLEYNAMLYNGLTETKDIIIDNGNVLGLEFEDNEINIVKDFEKLTYNEKLDLFKELFIRYDNNTYFKDNINIMTFDSNKNGFDIARLIDNYKLKN
ncbi:MAG: hypothetical protein SPF04_05500 [Bacilli bacterium]|nr:hypothetical protein [Bacilli bacterium]